MFDRDDHDSYHNALALAKKFNDKKHLNDVKQPLIFKAIVSIPSFELWLLLHYENIQAPLDRNEVMACLKQHFLDYEKGTLGAFAKTRTNLEIATKRAQALTEKFSPHTTPEPYTSMYELVTLLITLNN